MRKRVAFVPLVIFLLVAGFAAGHFTGTVLSRYRYEIVKREEFETDVGPLLWTSSFESFGLEMINTETTTLEFDGRLLYKAKRGFQSNAPHARDISIEIDGFSWSDGDYQFRLQIKPLEKVD